MNPYRDFEEPPSTPSHLSYSEIAAKLLQDNFLLTALELHTELVESGKELPQLREFFSNPGNFEQNASRCPENVLERCASQATLDSLDMARYSEDGAPEGSGGEVAVLEFELRKARETINSLRANLTQFADNDNNINCKLGDGSSAVNILPHEKRALNFIVNEYLLLQGYKLTSITFSDENPDQDFEDWDDVGLNTPRPSGLLPLYKERNAVHRVPHDEKATQFDEECTDGGFVCVSCQTSFTHAAEFNHEMLIQSEEIAMLKEQIRSLESHKINYEQLYDAAVATLNSLTTPTCDNQPLELSIPQERLQNALNKIHSRMNSKEELNEQQPLTASAVETHYSNVSIDRISPEQFEMIHHKKSSKHTRSTASLYERSVLPDLSTRMSSCAVSMITLDDSGSLQDVGDWTNVPCDDCTTSVTLQRDTWLDSSIPEGLKIQLLEWSQFNKDEVKALPGGAVLLDLLHADAPIAMNKLLSLINDLLPKIVESEGWLVALVAATIASGASRRRMLSVILNAKAPTQIIALGVAVSVRFGGGGETLATLAEYSPPSPKIAASALAAAPYLQRTLATSLLLSLILLMSESTDMEVRHYALKTVVLITPIAETKYDQIEDILFTLLRDNAQCVREDCVRVFAPLIARSALITGKLTKKLHPRIMKIIKKSIESLDWNAFIAAAETMKSILRAILVYVTNVQIVKDYETENMSPSEEICLEDERKHFIDLKYYHNCDNYDTNTLIISMNSIINNDTECRWRELSWFEENLLIPLLQMLKNSSIVSHENAYKSSIGIFSRISKDFGVNFATFILEPLLTKEISETQHLIERLQLMNKSSSVLVGIYLAGVLPFVEHREEKVKSFLQRWLVCSGVCGLPSAVLHVPISLLINDHITIAAECFKCMHEVAVDSRHGRSGTAIRQLLSEILNRVCVGDALTESFVSQHVLPISMLLAQDDDAKLECMDSSSSSPARRQSASTMQFNKSGIHIPNIFKRKS